MFITHKEELVGMIVRRIKDAVGSIIIRDGKQYRVLKFEQYGLVEYRLAEVTGIFTKEAVPASQVIGAGYQGSDHLVQIAEEKAPSSLTASLKSQVAKKDLTAQLKKQLDKPTGIQTGQIDTSKIKAAEIKLSTPGSQIIKTAEAITATIKPSPAAVAADLRSQVARSEAQQAHAKASVASKSAVKSSEVAAEALHQADEANRTASKASAEVAGVRYRLANVERKAEKALDVAGDSFESLREIDSRLSAIETKQSEEETKLSIQNELNAKLAQKKGQADLQAQFNASVNKNKTTGGNTMKNVFATIKGQFGKVEGIFAFSPVTNGLALRKGISAEFVAYDKATKGITDVSGLTLDINVPAFKLPTAHKDVKVGDIVLHNAEYVYVTAKHDGYLETINPVKGVKGSVIATKNALLGTTFYTVVKTLDAATGNNGGGFDPMLLMALGGDSKKDDLLPLLLMSGGLGGQAKQGQIDPTLLMLLGDDVEDLLPLVLMQQGGVAGEGFNPLMFLAMNKEGKKNDLLPLLLMSGQAGQGAQAGAFNPMMLLAMQGEGGGDFKDILMLQAMTGQNIFGGQAPAAPAQSQTPANGENTDENAGE